MSQTVSITAIASVSPLGNNPEDIWNNYLKDVSFFTEKNVGDQNALVATLDANSNEVISEIKASDNKYKSLDNSVIFAIEASRRAVENAGWGEDDIFGINIGSSRGATDLF